MKAGTQSATAIATAAARAAHLHVFDGARIHVDDFALRLAGFSDAEQLRASVKRWRTPSAARFSAYFALRHRFAEDKLGEAIDRGVRQVVLLGAGLDSLALRKPGLAQQLTLVEVDHPDSQSWKLARLAELQLSTPKVVYLPVDFANESLEQLLRESGLSLDQPTFFSWLGVTQYLDAAANDDMFRFIARRARGSEVVFDFIVKDELLNASERAFSEAAAEQSAARGEPWLSCFDPNELERHVAELGFDRVERLTPALAASRYYSGQPDDVLPLEAWQLIAASV